MGVHPNVREDIGEAGFGRRVWRRERRVMMMTITSPAQVVVAKPSPHLCRPRVVNRIMGTILGVETVAERLLHIRTDEGGSLDLRCEGRMFEPLSVDFLDVGQRVLIAVDADKVNLAPRCSQTLLCGNEWFGRVVLVEHERSLVTVKIRGQQITLRSSNVGSSSTRGWCAWDQTVISIAPNAVRIMPIGSGARLRRRLLTERQVVPSLVRSAE